MPNSLSELKRTNMEKRLASLYEDYEAANNQLNRALSDVDRVRLRRQIDGLEQEIQDVEDKLKEISQPGMRNKYRVLLIEVENILEGINQVLQKNQQALLPLFQEPPIVDQISTNMMNLFTQQTKRSAFGEWQSFLESALDIEDSSEIREIIQELLEVIQGLHESFYSYYDSSRNEQGYPPLKHFLIIAGARAKPVEDLRTIANDYLEFLRESVERVGRIKGKLRAMNQP